MVTLKEKDILKMFKDMGLATEEERKKFQKMAQDVSTDSKKTYIFIRATSTTSSEGGSKDTKLA